MIKVLKKAFAILEHVSQYEDSVPAGEIARAVDINQPTCSRIIKDLAAMGYLEQVAPMKGYTLGPAAYNLSTTHAYRRDLERIASPLVRQCAEEVGETVLIAVLKMGKRYILCSHNGNPDFQVITDQPFYEDAYNTATGRVQLAFMGDEELLPYVAKHGLPGKRWDNIDDLNNLNAALDKVRRNGYATTRYPDCQLAATGYPIFQNERFVAAIGTSVMKVTLTEERQADIMQILDKYAKLISAALSR